MTNLYVPAALMVVVASGTHLGLAGAPTLVRPSLPLPVEEPSREGHLTHCVCVRHTAIPCPGNFPCPLCWGEFPGEFACVCFTSQVPGGQHLQWRCLPQPPSLCLEPTMEVSSSPSLFCLALPPYALPCLYVFPGRWSDDLGFPLPSPFVCPTYLPSYYPF